MWQNICLVIECDVFQVFFSGTGMFRKNERRYAVIRQMGGLREWGEDDTVSQVIREFAKEGKLVAAICAAPSVLGQAGILNGKKAACHPGFEEKLTGAEVFFSPVVCDGNVITSRGMGTAVPFGLAVARYFTDDATIEHVKAGLVYA